MNKPEDLTALDSEKAVSIVAPLWRLVSRRANAIVPLNSGSHGPAFYCVHSIGGDVTKFSDLTRLLGPEQICYGIQVPRDKMTASFAGSIEAIAAQYVKAIVAFQPEGKIVLGGWSVGAVIALEMAQQLRAIGRDVPLLVALDGAPCNTKAGIRVWNPYYGWKLIRNLPRWIRDDQQHAWSFRSFIRRVVGKFAFHGQLRLPVIGRQTLHADAVQDLLNSDGWSSGQTSFIRALYAATRDYIPGPYMGRVIVYEAKTQPLWHLLQVGAAWRTIAAQIEIMSLDGSHTSLLQAPAVGALAEDLRIRLAAIRDLED